MWNEIKMSVHRKVPHNTYMLWIDPLSLLDEKENKLVISCPDPFSQKWITGNFMGIIRHEAEKILGQGIHIDLRIAETPDNKKQSTAQHQFRLPNIPARPQNGPYTLRPSFTFGRFVVGLCNDFAYTSALTLATERSHCYNSIFMMADTGLGKSHLSQAVGNKVLQEKQGARICYVTAENFSNEMVASLKNGRIEAFKTKYRNECDLLLLDDIQFLSGKLKIQDEISFTLDALFDANKKLIFASRYPLDEIPKMNPNLKSRLTSGILSSIGLPDYETRVKIIARKVEGESAFFPEDVIHFLASELTGDVRQIESGIAGILAKSSLLNLKIDMSLARSVIHEICRKKREVTMEEIRKLVCKYYKLSKEDILSRSRKRTIARPRQIAMYLARKHTDFSLQAIGRAFNRYHATTLHAIEAVENLLKKKGADASQVEFLSEKLERERH